MPNKSHAQEYIDKLRQMTKDAVMNGLKEDERAILDRVFDNLERVKSLLIIFQQLQQSSSEDYSDILRATVVLLHATVEDFLRTILEFRLPLAEPEFLAKIYFDRKDRTEKLSLADLKKRKETTIQELISNAVKDHLSKESFNNETDVIRWFPILGLKEKDKPLAVALKPMMDRRHQIVHRGDGHDIVLPTGRLKLVPILAEDVDQWFTASRKFIASITNLWLDASLAKAIKEGVLPNVLKGKGPKVGD